MKLFRGNFSQLRPQDIEDDSEYGAIDLENPNEYLSPFHNTKLGQWNYEFIELNWQLLYFETWASAVEQASDREKAKLASNFGLGYTLKDAQSQGVSHLLIVADLGEHKSCRQLNVFVDGLLYSITHDDLGNFLNLNVVDVTFVRKARSLPEQVTSLEDLLALCVDDTQDEYTGMFSLDLVIAKILPTQLIAQTGVFLPRGEITAPR
jgi:hypothetical protein